MTSQRNLPIGIQSFEKLRNSGCIYIDKTPFLWKLVQTSSPYFLSRPRRFGKSLFLSTLQAYFLGQKELFKGLAIEKLEEEKKEAWQKHPVLMLDLNLSKYETRNDLESVFERSLSNWEEFYDIQTSSKNQALGFAEIIKKLHKGTGKQVVILIDEYDKPLLQTMYSNEKLNEEYRNILKAFFGVIKSCDAHIRFAFLTGVTRFSRVSVFSDLNNLLDISMLPDYAGICGITQKEMEENFQPEIGALAQFNELTKEETLEKLRRTYNGYLFAQRTRESVYNPFSLLGVLEGKIFNNYWFATGTPTFLIHYLKKAHYRIPELDGGVRMTEEGLGNYRADPTAPVPILFQAGYLTIKSYDPESRLYTLGFPNDEVRYGFLENLLPAYSGLGSEETGLSVWEFIQDIRSGNVDGFMERMKAIIAGIPYDNFSKENLKLREQNYQSAIYLIFALMGQFVETEVHCATGRADAIVQTQDVIYIFEFKLNSQGTARQAIAQIKEKNYAAPFAKRGKTIMAIGASFKEEERTMGDWLQERL